MPFHDDVVTLFVDSFILTTRKKHTLHKHSNFALSHQKLSKSMFRCYVNPPNCQTVDVPWQKVAVLHKSRLTDKL